MTDDPDALKMRRDITNELLGQVPNAVGMGTTQTIFFWVYVAAGPLAWGLFAYLMVVARERMTKLRNAAHPLPTTPPHVTILVPAKDEAAHVRTCIERIWRQDYPDFDLIAINDRSSDDTGRVLDGLQADAETVGAHGNRFQVVHIDQLPEGWLGKCHALHRGTETASGEWLFFVDSDVTLQPDALRRMLGYAIAHSADAVSIMTAIQTERFVEKLMLPLLAGTWATVFMADQTNEDSQPDQALANGQVFLIRAAAYRAVGGHEAVKDRIVEDVELMRRLKKAGFKTRFAAGRHLASTRMHTHLGQMFHGWARIFAGTARGSVRPLILAIGFLFFSVLSVYPAIGFAISVHSDAWFIAGISHWLLMTICLGFVWIWSGNSPAWALLLPVSVPIEIALLIFSIHRTQRGNVAWRGTDVNLRNTSVSKTR